MNPMITLPQPQIADFCRRWQITELALFGSALRDDFRPDSDVDILVTFVQDAHPSLFDLVQMQNELEEMVGRPVDLATRRGVEASLNSLRKEAILTTAQVIYGS